MDKIDELDIDQLWAESENHPKIMDAIDAASDQDKSTWLTSGDRTVAAIVPVDVLEHDLARDWKVTSCQARRGDEVEAWLKRWRDEWPKEGEGSTMWTVLDDLLGNYRLHADTGTPLAQEVSEHG